MISSNIYFNYCINTVEFKQAGQLSHGRLERSYQYGVACATRRDSQWRAVEEVAEDYANTLQLVGQYVYFLFYLMNVFYTIYKYILGKIKCKMRRVLFNRRLLERIIISVITYCLLMTLRPHTIRTLCTPITCLRLWFRTRCNLN